MDPSAIPRFVQTQVRDTLGKISEIQPELWVQFEHSCVLHGRCEDGRSVTKKVSFIMAEIDKKLYHVFEKSCQRLMEPLSLEYPLALFMRRASYVKIEKAISCARNDSALLQERFYFPTRAKNFSPRLHSKCQSQMLSCFSKVFGILSYIKRR